jgi:hypothetical protein
MGQDVDSRNFTREDRQRYRAKVRRCLDVLAQMLAEARFDFDRPLTGLEIEFNLIDADQDPAMRNADVLAAIANEDFQTELGRFNIEINVRRSLAGRAVAELETELRASLNDAEERSRAVGAHIVMIGILPTLTPEHLTGESLSANPRYTLITNRSSRPGVRTCTSQSRASSGCLHRRTRSRPKRHARARSFTCRSARRTTRQTGTRPNVWLACSSPWVQTRLSCSARSCGGRLGSRYSSRPPILGRRS